MNDGTLLIKTMTLTVRAIILHPLRSLPTINLYFNEFLNGKCLKRSDVCVHVDQLIRKKFMILQLNVQKLIHIQRSHLSIYLCLTEHGIP